MTQKNKKRILITEVSGDCHHLRVLDNSLLHVLVDDPGTYCAANPHSDWEKINPEECKNCRREKHFVGITRAEAVERMSIAIAKDQWKRLAKENDTFEAFFKRHKVAFDNAAEAALDAILGH